MMMIEAYGYIDYAIIVDVLGQKATASYRFGKILRERNNNIYWHPQRQQFVMRDWVSPFDLEADREKRVENEEKR